MWVNPEFVLTICIAEPVPKGGKILSRLFTGNYEFSSAGIHAWWRGSMHGPCMAMPLIRVFRAAQLARISLDAVQGGNLEEKKYAHNISVNLYSVFMGAMNKWGCGLEGS